MSHVNINSNKLEQLCLAVIKRVKQERELAKREVAKVRADSVNSNWLHKKLKNKDISIEEMMEKIVRKNNIWDYDWYSAKIKGYKSINIAEQLLSSCKVATNVNVSTEDMEYLVGWCPTEVIRNLFGEKGYRD